MPEQPDFDALRLEGDNAWLALQRDDREPLRDFLVHVVDAIEAVSAPTGYTSELIPLGELQARMDALTTELPRDS